MSDMLKSGDIVQRLMERAPAFGIEPQTAFAIFVAENSKAGEWNPNRLVSLQTRSAPGAFGVMQVMPATHQGLIRNGYLPATNKMATLDEQLDAGLAAMKEMQESIGTKDPVHLATRYNTSISRYRNWAATNDVSHLMPETQEYQKKVRRTLGMDQNQAPMGTPAPAQPIGTGSGAVTMPTVGIPVVSQIAEHNTLAGSLMKMMHALTGEITTQSESIQKNVITAANAKTGAAKAGTDAANATEAMQQRILSTFGADATNKSAAIMKEQERYAVASQQVRNLEPELQRLTAMDPLKNPVEWLMGQFQLNALDKQYKQAGAIADGANKAINNIQAQASAQQRVQPAAVAEMRNEQTRQEAVATAAQASVQASEVAARAATQKIQMAKTELEFSDSAVSRSMQQERMDFERAQQKRVTDATNREQKDVENVNSVLRRFGKGEVGSLAGVRVYGKEAEELLTELQSSNGAYAKDLGQLMRATEVFGSMRHFTEKEPIMARFLERTNVLARAELNKVKGTQNHPDQAALSKMSAGQQLEYAANKVMDGWKKEAETKDMASLSKDNPWRLETDLGAGAPALKNNKIAKYVLDKMATGGVPPNEKELFSYAAALSRSSKGAIDTSTELTEFFREGMKYQYDKKGLSGLGTSFADPKMAKDKNPVSRYRISPASLIEYGLLESEGDPRERNVFTVGETRNLLMAVQMKDRTRVYDPAAVSGAFSSERKAAPAATTAPANNDSLISAMNPAQRAALMQQLMQDPALRGTMGQ